MKTIKGLIIIAVVLLFTGQVFGAAVGTVTQSKYENFDTGVRKIFFVCTGASDSGSIPNTATNTDNTAFIQGWRLEQVDAYPTSGGTAPDAADVFILDANGLDLLGSIDGSTTAYGGKSLIHATLAYMTPPQFYVLGTTSHGYYFPFISGALTLKVANQATNSANWTIVLTFYK